MAEKKPAPAPKPEQTEEQKNEALYNKGLAGAGGLGISGEPKAVPPPPPAPPSMPWMTPSADNPMWALAAALNKVNPYSGMQQPPQFSIPQLPMAGPGQLPTPPQAGMPRP